MDQVFADGHGELPGDLVEGPASRLLVEVVDLVGMAH